MMLTLILCVSGVAIGFLAQRSRICFIAGLRDFILVRDRELLNGLFSFLATVWVLTSLLYGIGMLRAGMPEFGSISVKQQISLVLKDEGIGARFAEMRILSENGLPVPLWSLTHPFLYVTIAGGFLLGVLSVQAGGCVLRQHVLTVQGDRDSLWYLIGFYAASPVFYLIAYRLFSWVY